MTSFFAQSFEFFSDEPEYVCAFLATTRPIFNSSIIPVTLNTTKLWNALSRRISYHAEKRIVQPLLEVFLLSDTLQFSPSMMLGSSSLSESFTVQLLETLIHERRYFCRTLKHFKSIRRAALDLVCQHVPSLETLDSSMSGIANWQPIARLTRLRELNLDYCNKVTDEDLQHFAGLSSLENLSLADTYVTGKGFIHFSSMKSLRVLNIRGIDDLCDEGLLCLPELPSLVELNLSNSYKITDVGFGAAVKKQKTLRILNLRYSHQISSDGLKSLRELPDLTDLDLTGCEINDNSLSELASIEGSLRRLSLGGCRLISDEGVTMIVNEMKDLVYLNLSSCRAVTDTSLKAISNLKFLADLRITLLPLLSDEGIHFLKNCPQLSTVSFGHDNYAITCSATDLSLEAFSRMKSLTHLKLYQAKTFTNNGVARLADSKSLERLELYGANDVTNDGMVSLSKSTALRMIKIKLGSQINKGAARFFKGTKIHVEID